MQAVQTANPSRCNTEWPLLDAPPLWATQLCWESFADDLDTILEDDLPADKAGSDHEYRSTHVPPTAARARPSSAKQENTPAKKPPAARTRPMSKEQRRKARNRAAQQQWRERQKVKYVLRNPRKF